MDAAMHACGGKIPYLAVYSAEGVYMQKKGKSMYPNEIIKRRKKREKDWRKKQESSDFTGEEEEREFLKQLGIGNIDSE